MDQIERDALNVIKARQLVGDEFVWDYEYLDDDGLPRIGAFKSFIKKLEGGGGDEE